MDRRFVAIISAVIVLIASIGVGTAIYFKNREVVDDANYSSVELTPAEMIFSEKSNKPNMELSFDNSTFAEAFGEDPTVFDYKKADRIRVHFSDGKKFELEPTKETVKVKKDSDSVSIKVYIDDKEIFESVNKLMRFDTACSIKVFFDEGTFTVNDGVSKAVTFNLKSENKLVSDVQPAYIKASYENYVLKFSMIDPVGEEIYFTTSGHTKDYITVYTDKTKPHTFSSNIVTTELFRTAILNPSESLENKTIYIYIPDGFFVCSEGNRIQVLGLKNTGAGIRLLKEEDVVTTTETPSLNTQTQPAVNLTSTDGVTAEVTFEEEFPNRYGEIIRNVTDMEVIIPTDADWDNCVFSASIISSSEIYDIPSELINVLKADTVSGYVANVSVRDVQTREINGVQIDGILFEESNFYDMEMTVADATGNIIANITVPLEI